MLQRLLKRIAANREPCRLAMLWDQPVALLDLPPRLEVVDKTVVDKTMVVDFEATVVDKTTVVDFEATVVDFEAEVEEEEDRIVEATRAAGDEKEEEVGTEEEVALTTMMVDEEATTEEAKDTRAKTAAMR